MKFLLTSIFYVNLIFLLSCNPNKSDGIGRFQYMNGTPNILDTKTGKIYYIHVGSGDTIPDNLLN